MHRGILREDKRNLHAGERRVPSQGCMLSTHATMSWQASCMPCGTQGMPIGRLAQPARRLCAPACVRGLCSSWVPQPGRAPAQRAGARGSVRWLFMCARSWRAAEQSRRQNAEAAAHPTGGASGEGAAPKFRLSFLLLPSIFTVPAPDAARLCVRQRAPRRPEPSTRIFSPRASEPTRPSRLRLPCRCRLSKSITIGRPEQHQMQVSHKRAHVKAARQGRALNGARADVWLCTARRAPCRPTSTET